MDSFIWTDQLVREYYDWKSVSKEPHFNHIEIFKQSKTIPKKEWEVLSFVYDTDNSYIFRKMKDGSFICNKYGDERFEESDFVQHTLGKKYPIFEVRRLLDGQIFELHKTKVVDPNTNHEWVISEIGEKQGKIYFNGVSIGHVKKVEDKEPILTDIEKINKRLDDMELKFKLWLHSVI